MKPRPSAFDGAKIVFQSSLHCLLKRNEARETSEIIISACKKINKSMLKKKREREKRGEKGESLHS